MNLYRRWISSPRHEMPYWLERVLNLVALTAGFATSLSLGSGLGERSLLYAAVATGIVIGSRILWRVMHQGTGY